MTEALQDSSLPEVIDVAVTRKNLTDALIGARTLGPNSWVDSTISAYATSVAADIDLSSATPTRVEQVTGRESIRREQGITEALRKHAKPDSLLTRGAIAASVPAQLLLLVASGSVAELDRDGFRPWEVVNLSLGYSVLRMAAMGTSLALALPQKRAQRTLDEFTELQKSRVISGATGTVESQVQEEAGIFIRAGRKRRFRRRTAALITAAGLLGFVAHSGELLDSGEPIKPTVRSGVAHDIDTEL